MIHYPRASGILLHPTSLPGKFGIGDLGEVAFRFIDFLSDTGQRLWQILPLGPTGYGNSPYQTLSVFAGNPLLISLEKLAEDRLLNSQDFDTIPYFSNSMVDYEAVIKYKTLLLKKSFISFEMRADKEELNSFESFCTNNASWLDIYSLFMAFREVRGFHPWNNWGNDVKKYSPDLIQHWSGKLHREIRYHKYIQFQFNKQWSVLKQHCNERGIKIIGDIPIFVALDSAEVWSHSEMFNLDGYGKPPVVAGVPPDYYNQAGQIWGNPLYKWDVIKEDNYNWWIERMKYACTQMDIIRLDHFRGFEKYWEIPATEVTAINGKWVAGPGADLFETIEKELGVLPIIAEDLGVITPEVTTLRDRFNLPGMKVLQFAFGNDALADEYKPHNYIPNCCVYTGTHDNNTTIGWFKGGREEVTTRTQQEMEEERKRALSYLGTNGSEINWDFIRLALMSVANIGIIPLQDVLGLGSEARMNIPGTIKGNWRWRFTFDMVTDDIKSRLQGLTRLSGR
jgi:4-alpha-glucanotransferase